MQLFVNEMWRWFDVHKRALPWRDLVVADPTERAYRILVSEMMLQQTQVERVKVIFKRFLEQFPTLTDLASATNADVILAWRGMGYNSRALRLRDAARAIVTEHQGTFPTEMTDLLAIKGIGHYTAAAVRNFAFHLPTPCIDTNIRRILHRTFVGPESADGTWATNDASLLEIAEEVLVYALKKEGKTTADWHAALMDFGSMIQTKRSPKWNLCPLTRKKIMKTTEKNFPVAFTPSKSLKKEPGRLVGSTFIPNRIFRGKIVEELRDAEKGLLLDEIGSRVCIDWDPAEHRAWLTLLTEKLIADTLLERRRNRYVLAQ